MNKVELLSHAKINLTLDVSALRPDGYHDIDSIAQVIDLKDELELSKADEGIIEVQVEGGYAPTGKDNIIYKACEVFFREIGFSGGARFILQKRIPVQAGLGGGSGNAAAAILGLNRMYETGLSSDQMCAMAAKAGSDAALFIHGGTVRMSGRGDYVTSLPDAPGLDLVIVKPVVGVSTVWAYAELDKREGRVAGNSSALVEDAIHAENRAALIASLSNDFDPIVSALVPEIGEAKRRLIGVGAEVVMLSGSGSAIFGVFYSEKRARVAADKLQGDFEQVFACRTLTRRESALGQSN